jgi:hypothetical protein
MNTENSLKSAVGYFVIILCGSLFSAALGAGFGALIAAISPEFVVNLFVLESEAAIVRYSLVVGMIWGLFIGGGVSGFGCLLAAMAKGMKGHKAGKGGAE